MRYGDVKLALSTLELVRKFEWVNKHIGPGSFVYRDLRLFYLQQMTENSGKLSSSVKLAHPELNWKELRNFRNNSVHAYGDVSNNSLKKLDEDQVTAFATP